MEEDVAATHQKKHCWLPPLRHLPFLLANGKPLWSGGIVPSLGDERKPTWIAPIYPVAWDWCTDGFGPTSGWHNIKIHTRLLGDRRKYFIPEKREAKVKKALLSSLLPVGWTVTLGCDIESWQLLHTSEGTHHCQARSDRTRSHGSVHSTQVSYLSTTLGPSTPSFKY